MQERTLIRHKLLEIGLNISQWAVLNGFNPIYVHQVLTRYGVNGALNIKSPRVFTVIKQLEADTGINLLSVKKV